MRDKIERSEARPTFIIWISRDRTEATTSTPTSKNDTCCDQKDTSMLKPSHRTVISTPRVTGSTCQAWRWEVAKEKNSQVPIYYHLANTMKCNVDGGHDNLVHTVHGQEMSQDIEIPVVQGKKKRKKGRKGKDLFIKYTKETILQTGPWVFWALRCVFSCTSCHGSRGRAAAPTSRSLWPPLAQLCKQQHEKKEKKRKK